MVFTLSCLCVSGQKSLAIRGTRVTENKIYLNLDRRKIETFQNPNNEAGKERWNGSAHFAINSRTCNIFVKWLNPLHYTLSWSDSIYVDENDAAVKAYFDNLKNLFVSNEKNIASEKKESLSAVRASGLAAPVPGQITYPPDGFNSVELTILYLHLRTASLSAPEIAAIDALTTKITVLDELNSQNITRDIASISGKLFGVESASDMNIAIPESKKSISEIVKLVITPTQNSIESIPTELAKINLADKLTERYLKNEITQFIKQATVSLAAKKNLVDKFDPIFKLISNSLKIPGDVPIRTPSLYLVGSEEHLIARTEYYEGRIIELEDGKEIQTSLTLIENEFDSTAVQLKEKQKTNLGKLIFKKYDPIAVFLSVGGFWSNTKLAGFGVDDNLKITEEEIIKDTFVSAAFLNFSFGPSRYMSPLVQFGVDPTKKRPFLLLGSGLSIPVARIAFSIGGVWTWQATLQKLRAGDIVKSTTNLEQDIAYRFSGKPRGWYFGIQFDF